VVSLVEAVAAAAAVAAVMAKALPESAVASCRVEEVDEMVRR